MINLPLGSSAAASTLRNGLPSQRPAPPAQADLDLTARNPEIAGRNPEEAGGTGIASLVQLNLSFEAALQQAQQIKSLLSLQPFSIANEEPNDILTLVAG